MLRPYSGPETASDTDPAAPLHDKHRGRNKHRGRTYPPVEQDGRDLEARQMLAAYYRRLWRRARDLQDPTWWMARARERGDTL